MKKSIVVSVINGKLFPTLPSCHNVFEVREGETGLLLSDRLSIHFLELEKVDITKPVSEMTSIEKLAVYLKYASDEAKKDVVQKILAEEEIIMAENAYRKLTQDEIEYERLESEYRSRLFINTEISIARKEGREEGLQEGLQAGRKEGLQDGRKEGLQAGEEKLNKLNLLLIEESRIDDLQRAAKDETYRQQLYLEFGL